MRRLWLAIASAASAALFSLACQGGGLNNDGETPDPAAGQVAPSISGVSRSDGDTAPPCSTRVMPWALSSGGQQLLISGANFDADARVRVGPLLAGVVSAGAGQISVTAPPGSPGSTEVIVVNADGRLARFNDALILCPDAASTTEPTAQLVASPARVEIGQQLDVELQVLPGTADDLRDVRPTVAVDESGMPAAAATRLTGPSPAGADLRIGAPPAVFRYTYRADREGDLALLGRARGLNADLDTEVLIPGPTGTDFVDGPELCVEPLIVSAELERSTSALGQIFRVFVDVANAGAETVTGVVPEGADPDGGIEGCADQGSVMDSVVPDALPTSSGSATVTLRSVSARVVSGDESLCTPATLPALPSCDIGAREIVRFELTYTPTGLPICSGENCPSRGSVAFSVNAAGTSASLGEVRGVTKVSPVLFVGDPLEREAASLAFGTAPPAAEQPGDVWPAFTVEILNASGTVIGVATNEVNVRVVSAVDEKGAEVPGTLQGTTAVSAVNGIATFDDVSFPGPALLTVEASIDGITVQAQVEILDPGT